MPDRRIADGEIIDGGGWALEAVATPGHTANHMAFALRGTDVLFSGDHVMAWSTSVVAPPDGAMSDYMASLDRLAARPETVYLAGHGDVIRNAPGFVAHYIRHRRGREAAILRRLAGGESDIPALVRAIYVGLDPRLAGAAGLSVLAHLEDLVARGLVATDGAPSIGGRYRLGRLSGLGRDLRRRLGRPLRLLRLVGAHRIVDVIEQRQHPRRVGAEVAESRSATPSGHRRARRCAWRGRAPPRHRASP